MLICACYGTQLVSRAIQVGSINLWTPPRWPPSHVALILKATPEVEQITGDPYVWVESSTLIPRKCVLANRQVIGVQCHRIKDRWTDYPQGAVQLYKLIEPLSADEETFLSTFVFDALLKNYLPTSSSLIKQLLFKTNRVPLCSEFAKDVLVWAERSERHNRTWYSPGSFLREHINKTIIPI